MIIFLRQYKANCYIKKKEHKYKKQLKLVREVGMECQIIGDSNNDHEDEQLVPTSDTYKSLVLCRCQRSRDCPLTLVAVVIITLFV